MNATQFTRTLYGVTFKPGAIASVPGYINLFGFIQVSELDQKPSVTAQHTPTPKTPGMTKKQPINTGGEQLDG